MTNQNKEHPEIQDFKNICDIIPDSEEAKEVCNRANKDSSAKEQKQERSLDDSANPGNQYIAKNRQPKEMQKKGFNNAPKIIKKP